MDQKINIAIVDDYTLQSQLLAFRFKEIPGFETVIIAKEGEDFFQQLNKNTVDVALVDWKMDGLDGPATTRALGECYPEIKFIVLTGFRERKITLEALRNGAKGVLHKDIEFEKLVDAIRKVMLNEYVLKHDVTMDLLIEYTENGFKTTDTDAYPGFDSLDFKITKGMIEDLSEQQIAEKVFKSIQTVKARKAKIMEKLNLNGVAALAIYVYKNKRTEFED